MLRWRGGSCRSHCCSRNGLRRARRYRVNGLHRLGTGTLHGIAPLTHCGFLRGLVRKRRICFFRNRGVRGEFHAPRSYRQGRRLRSRRFGCWRDGPGRGTVADPSCMHCAARGTKDGLGFGRWHRWGCGDWFDGSRLDCRFRSSFSNDRLGWLRLNEWDRVLRCLRMRCWTCRLSYSAYLSPKFQKFAVQCIILL